MITEQVLLCMLNQFVFVAAVISWKRAPLTTANTKGSLTCSMHICSDLGQQANSTKSYMP
jgi:hypothetical protein